MSNKRIIATVVVLLSIIFLPYWIYLPLLLAAILYFPFYWEGIVLGLMVDALYGSLSFSSGHLFRSIGLWSAVLLIILLPMRRLLRTYA